MLIYSHDTLTRRTCARNTQVEDISMVQAYLTDLGLLGDNEVAFAVQMNDLTQAPARALQSPAPPSERAAVCVTGVFRAGPFTWPWYKEHVLSQLGMPYDVYVSTPNMDTFPHVTDYLYFMHPYKVVYPDYSGVDKLLALPGWDQTGFTGAHKPGKWLMQITVRGVLARWQCTTGRVGWVFWGGMLQARR